MSFASLGLADELLRAVADQGYEQATPIQEQAIPVILEGRDIMAGAQTGTGKTAGFTLPLLNRLKPFASSSTSPARHPVRALILTPTRELALQVEESVRTYGKYLPLRSTVVYGGVHISTQIKALKEGVEILVATPGRLLDHVEQKTVNLGQVQILVLDEADRMLDMGFMPDLKRIIALLPKQRQNLLFSATFADEIKKLADQLLTDPVIIEVARRNTAAETVTQIAYQVDRERKRALLTHLITTNDWRQVLVFTKTKHGADRLCQQLQRDGVSAAAIHGDKTQSARVEALDHFKQGVVRVLVATDVAARGLDIDQLPHVVNYELPHVPEDYVHRIGRTGRAGASGEAISLVDEEELRSLADIERVLNRSIPLLQAPGFIAHDAAAFQAVRIAPKRSREEHGERGARPRESRPRESRPEASIHLPPESVSTPEAAVRPSLAASQSAQIRNKNKPVAALFLPPVTPPEAG
jgi:ATP-dependent RNA helicase RhlE